MARLRRSTRPPAARRLPTVRARELGTPGGRGSGCEGSSPRARDRRGYPAVVAGRSRFIPAPRGSAVRGCRVGGPALAARVLGGTQSRRPLFSFGAAVLGPASFPASARWPPATTQLFHALRPRLPDGVAGAVCYGYRGIEDRIVGAVQLEAVSGEGRRIRWLPNDAPRVSLSGSRFDSRCQRFEVIDGQRNASFSSKVRCFRFPRRRLA